MVNRVQKFLATLALSGFAISGAAAQSLSIERVQADDAVRATAAQSEPGLAQPAIAPRPDAGLTWSVEQAQVLLRAIQGTAMEGLNPADYQPEALRAAIAAGEGEELNRVASAVFTWLVADYRDGHTPLAARNGYLMEDSDAALLPTPVLMERALANGDVRGVLGSLLPSHPDYAALRAMLSITPASDEAKRDLIRANMDRWRWLPRDLGGIHLLANIPEFMLRLTVDGEVIRTYRTIVGQPGRNATPQLAEMVEGVIFNPTWTVPQSIVAGEGLGRRVLGNPSWAQTMGYVATRSAGGAISVVQQPGPRNALGKMKLDMPNAHAIFLHDTNNRTLFGNANRALSHGCVRVENALELAATIAQLGQGGTVDDARMMSESGDYTRMPLAQQLPVYLAYFTMRVDESGQLVEYRDIYSRDAPVLAALDAADRRSL